MRRRPSRPATSRTNPCNPSDLWTSRHSPCSGNSQLRTVGACSPYRLPLTPCPVSPPTSLIPLPPNSPTSTFLRHATLDTRNTACRHHSRPHHVHVHIRQAVPKVPSALHGRAADPSLPEPSPSALPLVVLPGGAPRRQLDHGADRLPGIGVNDNVHVVGGDAVSRHRDAVPQGSLPQPSAVGCAVPLESQQKLPLVAPVGEVVGIRKNYDSACPPQAWLAPGMVT